ncbi:MAG TPA: hypothetical protein PKA99_02840 [Dermatophilaceae bacterium]|nr:hypothetical protein [Dermatophilaceae bacterium]
MAAPTGGAATSGGTPANPSGPAAPSGPSGPVRLIGDGSTADTGPQPNQPAPPTKLKPGERPPQFVVVSWDGAGADRSGLFETWREFAAAHHVPMTFFLTGLYMLPASHRTAYTSPGRAAGASAIPWFGDEAIRATIENVRAAWLKGHEIGTHFNGHFCGPKGGSSWSPADWDHEIAQAKQFVSTWRTTTGFDLPPLPFDYEKELVGARTPCLEGQAGLVKASAVANWRYDSSGAGTQVWPRKLSGTSLWNIPLELIPFNGSQVLSMDYNFYATQSRAKTGDPASYAGWQAQARDAYLAGFQRAYTANRAPLIIGNHFESWNGGIYMAALREALTQMVSQPDVRFVTFKQLCDWLDAQDPAVLASLQRLPVGQAPTAGWTKTS